MFAPERKAYPFEVDRLSTVAESGRFSVWLQGTSDFLADPDHHVRVYVNGTLVQESSWDGKNGRLLETELLPGLLREGENLLELENVGDTAAQYSMVMLNRFSVRYPRVLRAEGGRLEGSWSESGVAAIGGLADGAHVVDVTESPRRWLSAVERTSQDTVRFQAEAGRSYLAVDGNGIHRAEVRRPVANRLKSTRNRASYLVIAPAALLREAEPLLRHRRSQGLVAELVSTEAIYSEFGFGEATPRAIQDFLSYAYHRWRLPPKYVLLLGDGTYDYKDYLQTGVVNQLPPFMVRTTYLWTASDPAYASVNGDDILPDLAIGRLPAASPEELRAMVEKILIYEDGDADMRSSVVLVAGQLGRGGCFRGRRRCHCRKSGSRTRSEKDLSWSVGSDRHPGEDSAGLRFRGVTDELYRSRRNPPVGGREHLRSLDGGFARTPDAAAASSDDELPEWLLPFPVLQLALRATPENAG